MVFQLQGMVNGWLRLNQKHVVFPPQEDTEQQQQQHQQHDNSSTIPTNSLHSLSHTQTQTHSLIKTLKREQVSQGTATTTTTITTTTATTADTETQAIRRFKTRLHSRKLQRTVSHTDLLREMAKENEKQKPRDTVGTSLSEQGSHDLQQTPNIITSTLTPTVTLPAVVKDDNNENSHDHSLRFVAGFFGTDIPQQPINNTRQSQHRPKTTLQHSHDKNNTLLQQKIEHTSRTTSLSNHQRTLSQGTLSSEGRLANKLDSSSINDSVNSGVAVPPSSMRGTPPLPKYSPEPKNTNPINHFFRAFPQSRHHCASCEELERRLLATHADIEYLRSVALRNEYVCKECESQRHYKTTDHELATVSEASKRLIEITARHQQQMEQLTKERAKWQHDMTDKLSKMTSACQELNVESELRIQEALDLRQELSHTRDERDALVAQVEESRAEATIFEREQQEHRLLKKILIQYETEGLLKANEAVQQRNKVISDLSTRLERTMDTLNVERQQQRLRRQIIFPAKNLIPSAISGDDQEASSLKEQLRMAIKNEQQAQSMLESTKAEADRTDKAWTAKYQELETQLKSFKTNDFTSQSYR